MSYIKPIPHPKPLTIINRHRKIKAKPAKTPAQFIKLTI